MQEEGGILEEIMEPHIGKGVDCWTSNPRHGFSLFVSPLPLMVTFLWLCDDLNDN